MFRRAIASIMLVAIFAAPATAQRRAKPHKGIRCGNSWISASKTCRIGTSATTTPDTASHSIANSTPTLSTARALGFTGDGPSAIPAPTGDSALHPPLPAGRTWIASIADRVYFHPDCTAAQDIAVGNRAMFLAEQAAVNAGYRRSRTPGC